MTHIGIDFDNTIVHYDDVFYRCALERKLIPPGGAASKGGIKDYLRLLPGGPEKWTALQAVVYGERMGEAVFKAGAERFIKRCRRGKIAVSVISHKTVFDASGCGLNLREAARKWMQDNGFFSDSGLGLGEGDVFFEATRAEKIGRIVARQCTHFIDDLPEVFNEPAFPGNVAKLHYNPQGGEPANGAMQFAGWDEIYGYFFRD